MLVLQGFNDMFVIVILVFWFFFNTEAKLSIQCKENEFKDMLQLCVWYHHLVIVFNQRPTHCWPFLIYTCQFKQKCSLF